MKTKHWPIAAMVAALAVTAGILVFTGCEDEPNTDISSYLDQNPYESSGRVNPSIADLKLVPEQASAATVGQEIEFRVDEGRSPFTWTVANHDAGHMHVSADTRHAIYKVERLLPNQVIARDVQGRYGVAEITAAAAGALKIIPSSITLTATNAADAAALDGHIINFRVDGGVEPYGPWMVSDPQLGTIDPNTGVYTVNTDDGEGENIVSISDSAGSVATATVRTDLP